MVAMIAQQLWQDNGGWRFLTHALLSLTYP